MSAITTLAAQRVQALGAVSYNAADPASERMSTLIDMALELVLSYLAMSSDDALLLSDQLQGVIATVVADMVAPVLAQNSRTHSTDGGYEMDTDFATVLLKPENSTTLDRAFATSGVGSTSLVITRDSSSSFVPDYTNTTTVMTDWWWW